MERTPVSSDNLSSVGYDVKSMTLEIEFNSGGIYQYFEVPEYVYQQLMIASSHGKYLANNIKGIYRYAKL